MSRASSRYACRRAFASSSARAAIAFGAYLAGACGGSRSPGEVTPSATPPARPTVAAELDQACTFGVGASCAKLATMLFEGSGVARDDPRALALLDRACHLGVEDACRELASKYRVGLFAPKDLSRATHLLEYGCELGHGRSAACVDLADTLLLGKRAEDDARAVRILEHACVEEEPKACQLLGLLFVEGLVPLGHLQPGSGERFYRRACDLGHTPACLRLARLYGTGSLLPRDDGKARELFEIACRRGNAEGCAALHGP